MSADETFEIDTAPTPAAAETDQGLDAENDEPVDNRPTWDVEYKLGDGGGVTEIKADSADEARTTFAAGNPGAEILTVEPG